MILNIIRYYNIILIMSASIISKYINKYKYNTYIKFEFIINNSKTNNDLFIYELNTDHNKYTNLINIIIVFYL